MRIAVDGIPLLSPKTGIGRYTSEVAVALRRLPGVLRISVFYGIHWSKRLRGSNLADNGERIPNLPDDSMNIVLALKITH